MSGEAWEQQTDEPRGWYQRFDYARVHGARSVTAAYNSWRAKDDAAKSRDVPRSPARNASKTWHREAGKWRWEERWAAWDKHLVDEAAAEIEAEWRAKAMGAAEVLGRISDMGRSSITDFVTLSEDGRIVGYNEDALHEQGCLVKKISSSSGKTESRSIELYDAQAALMAMGKHLGLFNEVREHRGSVEVIGATSEQHDRALSTLAEALGALLPRESEGEPGDLDAAEPAAVAGTAEPGG